MKAQGILALDIDGTTTAAHDHVPSRVVEYLHGKVEAGWRVIFITGRPFCHCTYLFENLPFACHVAPQNGALLIELPSRKIVSKRYVSSSVLPELESILLEEPSDFVLYLGPEFEDRVLYREDRFCPTLRHLIQRRVQGSQELWQLVETYRVEDIPSFASVKCFGEPASARRVASALESRLGLYAPVIQDPFDRRFCVVQGTHAQVNKGQALLDFAKHIGSQGLPMIAAGDDENDLPLLKVADVAIAMGSAPTALKALADVQARSAEDEGLIEGLEYAISIIGK